MRTEMKKINIAIDGLVGSEKVRLRILLLKS